MSRARTWKAVCERPPTPGKCDHPRNQLKTLNHVSHATKKYFIAVIHVLVKFSWPQCSNGDSGVLRCQVREHPRRACKPIINNSTRYNLGCHGCSNTHVLRSARSQPMPNMCSQAHRPGHQNFGTPQLNCDKKWHREQDIIQTPFKVDAW